MKSYIIRLSEYNRSVRWSANACTSATQHGWNVEYFEGIDGTKTSLCDYGIRSNKQFKKGAKYLEKPGVVGCFLSHYMLWKKCIELNEPICILEHDVTIRDVFPKLSFNDVIKLTTGPKAKHIYVGNWYEGAMAYCVTPAGATKLLDFTLLEGAMPADVMLCDGIVDLNFYDPINTVVTYVTDEFSFTKDHK